MATRSDLLASLRAKPAAQFTFSNWVRIVDYRYCLAPLSPAGSLRGVGGRFNIGQDLGLAGFASWPALYLAEDLETAYREKFHCRASSATAGLTPIELALQSKAGFLVAPIQGHISSILDIDDADSLRPFCSLIGKFTMPAKVRTLAKALRIHEPQLVRSPRLLQRAVLSRRWRAVPMQFDFPAPSQVFGNLVKDAGYEALLYKSSQNGKRCLVVFPERLVNSDSFVDVTGDCPKEITTERLDQFTWPEMQDHLLL
ncbi:MAG: RES family NAD+ phosphorylase [Steroidobacteraceae bacterium]